MAICNMALTHIVTPLIRRKTEEYLSRGFTEAGNSIKNESEILKTFMNAFVFYKCLCGLLKLLGLNIYMHGRHATNYVLHLNV